MRLKKDFTYKPEEGWHRRVLILWEEDDARPPDREVATEAFARIFKTHHTDRMSAYAEEDDACYSLLLGHGAVIGYSCGLGFVGVLVKEEQ